MSSLRRDLFQRRLWLLLVALVALLVAAPVYLMLRQHARPTPIPLPGAIVASAPAPAKAKRGQPVVLRRHTRHSHLPSTPGAVSRDPFGPPAGASKHTNRHPSDKAATAASSSAGSADASASGSGSSVAGSSTPASSDTAGSTATGASTGASTAPTSSPVITTTTSTTESPPVETSTHPPAATGPWTIYAADVRIGAPHHMHSLSDLARLTPLPSVASPAAMFLGMMKGGHKAVFALADGVKAVGPGVCRPSHDECSEIILPLGGVEGLAALQPDGSVKVIALALSRVDVRITHSRAVARAAYKRRSAVGACEVALASPTQYDQTNGAVSPVDHAACKGFRHAVPFPGSPSDS